MIGNPDTLFVNSNNHPRYKAYQDSLLSYNQSNEKYDHLKNLINQYGIDENLLYLKSNNLIGLNNTMLRSNSSIGAHTISKDKNGNDIIITDPKDSKILRSEIRLHDKPKQVVALREKSNINKMPILSALIQTGTLDKHLADVVLNPVMNRHSQTIERPNAKGQMYPVGERHWDNKRKSWWDDYWDKDMQKAAHDLIDNKVKF